MIEHHPDLECPPDDAVLWRFMDFTKFVELLDTGRCWFSHIKKMEDPFEGAMTKPIAEGTGALRKAYDQFGDNNYFTLVKGMATMRETTCVSCWHMSLHESAAMWKLYLKSDEGVAIRTTFAHMKRAFSEAPDLIFPAVVKYIDYATEEFSLDNAFFPVVHKRKSFQHEAEMRLIWWASATVNRKLFDGLLEGPVAYPAPGRAVMVNLPELLQQVYVSPTSDMWFGDLVGSVVKKYGVTCPVEKSDLYSSPIY